MWISLCVRTLMCNDVLERPVGIFHQLWFITLEIIKNLIIGDNLLNIFLVVELEEKFDAFPLLAESWSSSSIVNLSFHWKWKEVGRGFIRGKSVVDTF